MKYRVTWHDCEDDRTGASFEIEGSNPSEAYFKAEDYIRSLSPYLQRHHCGIDIECLVDEQGKYHLPDFFLKENSQIKQELEETAEINQAGSRLVLISGPSGVGKGPIIEWTKKLYTPDLCQIKVKKTKTERHKGSEDDLGFGKGDNFYQFDCRGVEQRIYLDELDNALKEHNIVLLEAYYNALDFLKNRYGASIYFASIFVSPLNIEEINELAKQGKKLEDYLPNLMLDSLIKRAERDGKAFTRALIKELEQRAEDSINEIKFAHNYKQIIPNHCYESDSRWRFPFLIGEPLRVVKSLREIIEKGKSDYAYDGEDYKINEK